jgi:hypothetical protein
MVSLVPNDKDIKRINGDPRIYKIGNFLILGVTGTQETIV